VTARLTARGTGDTVPISE